MSKEEKIIIKIGIDFGKTIGLVEQEEPYKDSYSVIRFLKNKYGNENIYIISKARIVMINRISEWLLKNNFFEETGLLKENLIFCDNYEDKAILVTKLKINVFIDDHIKVIQSLIQLKQMVKIIWFNKDVNLKLIDKDSRNKIILTNKWNKMIKIFQNLSY